MTARTLGAIKFRSARAAALYLLKHSHLSQTAIASKLRVSILCVNQVAMQIKSRHIKPVKIGAVSYRSRRAAARYYLTRTHLTQTAIAQKLNCSIPCVNQVASELKAA